MSKDLFPLSMKENETEQSSTVLQRLVPILIALAIAGFVVMAGTAVISAQQTSEKVELESPTYMPLNSTSDYRVYYINSTGQYDVTDQAAVATDPGLTANRDKGLLNSTDNSSLQGDHTVAIQYTTPNGNTYYKTGEVAVFDTTVANIPDLPFVQRVTALISDETLFSILIATIAGSAAAIIATSFAGLGMAVIVMGIAWVLGWAATGIMMIAAFMAIFLGMNIAANIDYSTIR